MRPIPTLAATTLIGLFAAGCATMSIGSYVQRGLVVSNDRTFDWGPADALPTGDPRLDKDPFFQDHMEGAVEKAFARKGLRRVESGAPDLLVHYHANITDRIDVGRADQNLGYCYTENCESTVVQYEAGTLVLDVVDARTNRVIWRGWAQKSLEGVLGNPDRMAAMIDNAVRRMLDRFPQP